MREKTEGLFRRTQGDSALARFRTPGVLVQLFVSFLIIGFYLLLLVTPALRRLEHVTLDAFFRCRPAVQTHPAIVYVEIAEDSLQTIGRWPWPRRYHATMAHFLNKWEAHSVVFDMLFSEASAPFEDGALREALERNRNVYLPVVLEPEGKEKRWIHSLPIFSRHAKALGHINIVPDSDGTLRRVQPFLRYGLEVYPHLALKVAHDYLGREMPPADKLPWGQDEKGNLLINWAGRWADTFAHYSYVDLLRSFEAVEKGETPIISPEEIRGKICLVGLTATGHSDIKATPMESAYPALGVHANLINSILLNRFVRPAPFLANALFLLGVGFLSLLFFVPYRQGVSIAAAVALGAAGISVPFMLFWQRGIWFLAVHPLLLVLSLFLLSVVYAQRIGHRERMRLFNLATRDGLTGLFVIRHFRSILNQTVREASRQRLPLSLLLLDIDHFKQINDSYGHPAGDMILREVARVLQTFVRSKRAPSDIDSVARYGGEEFIVLLRNCSIADAAAAVAERLRVLVEKTRFEWEGKAVRVTISIGVSTLHSGEDVPDPMVHRADEALYRAKVEGRNRVCLERAE